MGNQYPGIGYESGLPGPMIDHPFNPRSDLFLAGDVHFQTDGFAWPQSCQFCGRLFRGPGL
tara:strand:- start:1150 stop:1332 length:183 start_codon:yes stop_codon:yes gene_type:complete